MSSSSLENTERYTVYRGGYEQRSESLVGITSGPSHSSPRSVVALTRAQRERERERERESRRVKERARVAARGRARASQNLDGYTSV